ncbi:unnamed protein product [Arabidopsis halleri]
MSGLRQVLDGKIVIVTGGASGLFTDHGAKVVIVDIQEELGQNLAVSIGLDKTSFYRCNVTEETEVENAVKFTVEKHGKLDVLFSNPGVMEAFLIWILRCLIDRWRSTFAVRLGNKICGAFGGG